MPDEIWAAKGQATARTVFGTYTACLSDEDTGMKISRYPEEKRRASDGAIGLASAGRSNKHNDLCIIHIQNKRMVVVCGVVDGATSINTRSIRRRYHQEERSVAVGFPRPHRVESTSKL